MSSRLTIVQPDVCLFLFMLGLQFSMPYGMPKKQEENGMWINFLRSLPIYRPWQHSYQFQMSMEPCFHDKGVLA
jgi:hypothetical protein